MLTKSTRAVVLEALEYLMDSVPYEDYGLDSDGHKIWQRDEDRIAEIDAALAEVSAAEDAPQPDWSQAPAWAQWWAVYPDGIAHWHETEPLKIAAGWASKGHSWLYADIDIPLGIDWRLLKVKRPDSTQEDDDAIR